MHTPVGIKCTRCTAAPTATIGRRQRLGVAALVLGVVVVAGMAFTLLRGEQSEGISAGSTAERTGGTRQRVVEFPGAAGLRLGGTLRFPEGDGPFPGVVVIPGFGPTDRDGVALPAGMADRLYQDLADRLAEAGVASLRYDKRGTGESRLDADQALEFDHMVADAAAALVFLTERPEIDARAVGLVGHDEGGLSALQVAATDAAPASALVLISTPGRPLAAVLADDLLASTEDPADAAENARQLHAVVDELLATGELPEPDDLPTALRPVFPPDQERYLRAIFAVDPTEDAADVDVPALIVRGGRDSGVSAEDSDRLVAALGDDSEVLVGAESGHTLAVIDDDETGGSTVIGERDHDRSMGSHQADGPVRDEELLASIATWVATTLGVEPATSAEADGR